MELGEAAAVNLLDDFNHQEDSCTFCKQEKPPKDAENILDDQHEEDDDLDGLGSDDDGIRFKNDSAKLGKALEDAKDAQPVFWVEVPLLSGTGHTEPLKVTTAAHHLIPGNAALSPSTLFKSNKYLRVDKMAAGNIGYNVNKAENGVWLPGNYAQRPWGTDGKKFEIDKEASAQAYAAAASRQGGHFHDAHEDYSRFVKGVLDKLKEELDQGAFRCPQAPKDDKEQQQMGALRSLVNRMNAISARMRGMLTKQNLAGMKTHWRRNIFTSSRMVKMMKDAPEAKAS